MSLKFAKHERVWLKQLPEFSEAWLHKQIKEDTSILGLGDLEVRDSERVQQGAGRLDILLADNEDDSRYEVEIMLGPTDPSHIIRCIEYWDIERRRYPAYDHVAVLVAEDITSRFLNVMSLLSGSIPLIAIQLTALRIGDQLVLDFVRVLDQRELREEPPPNQDPVNRDSWEKRVGGEILKLCDRTVEIANEVAQPKLELKYLKSHIGLCPHGSFFNAAALFPKKGFLPIRSRVTDSAGWLKKLQDAGVEAKSRKPGSVTVLVRPADMVEKEALIRGFLHQAVKEFHDE